MHWGRSAGILRSMYSAAVLDHFKSPRNAGELADATVTVEVSNPVCGDILQLAVYPECLPRGGRERPELLFGRTPSAYRQRAFGRPFLAL